MSLSVSGVSGAPESGGPGRLAAASPALLLGSVLLVTEVCLVGVDLGQEGMGSLGSGRVGPDEGTLECLTWGERFVVRGELFLELF